jgi:rRNA maturation endonuclease Nob1
VTLLKDIRSAIWSKNSISKEIPSLQLCEGCNRNFQKEKLKKIASGQLLCPECISNLKKRS